MRIVIHCHGGADLGVGHVMRSLALAEEAQASGHAVTMVGEHSGTFLESRLAEVPVGVRRVARSDPAALQAAVRELDPDVVHLDTYDPVSLDVGAAVLSNLEDAIFGRREADLVVDPTLGAETEPREAPVPRALLRGSRYAPLRAEVLARRGEWQLRDDAHRVLVVMGGADPLHLTPKALRVLAETGLPLHVTAVVRPDARAECEEAAGTGMQVDLVPPVDDLAALMAHQDLVVSAAGTSVWELCCLGVPSALLCAVDNQQVGYQRVVAAGAAIGLGSDLEGDEAQDAAKLLREVLENPATRQDLSRQAVRLVDGLGAWRVVRAWEQLARGGTAPAPDPASVPVAGPGLRIRDASMADADRLLAWRNDPATRRASRQQDAVPRGAHLAWLEASLDRPDRVLTVVSDGRGDLGTVRWDRVDDVTWEVSITLAPERRGEGLSRAALETGVQHLLGSRREVHALLAAVHEDNAGSHRLFEGAGFWPDAPPDEQGFWTYRRPVLA